MLLDIRLRAFNTPPVSRVNPNKVTIVFREKVHLGSEGLAAANLHFARFFLIDYSPALPSTSRRVKNQRQKRQP
jgi:hypothetical protein